VLGSASGASTTIALSAFPLLFPTHATNDPFIMPIKGVGAVIKRRLRCCCKEANPHFGELWGLEEKKLMENNENFYYNIIGSLPTPDTALSEPYLKSKT
jgi:hypothetical protein